MLDTVPLHIVALFLTLSSLSTLTYIASDIPSPFHRSFDVTLSGLCVFTGSVITIWLLFTYLLSPDYALLAGALALGICAALIHPVAAMGFFVSLLFLRPWEFLPQEPVLKVLPRLTAALTAGRWLLGRLRARNQHVVTNASSVLFLIFLTWIPLSALFSLTPGASLSYFFESFSPTSVLTFLLVNSLTRPKDVQGFLRSFVISGVGILSVAFYITCRDYIRGTSDFRLHSVGLWGNSNDLAALAVLILPLTIFSIRRQTAIWTNIPAVLSGLVFLAGLLWSQSRAAQGAALLGGVAYFLCCGMSKRVTLIIAPAIVIACVAVAAAMPQRDLADTTGSSESRYNYIIAGLRMARAYPLFGVGVGNYPYLYEQYTPAFIETGNRTAHSTWILTLSETGVAGLALLWALYGSVAVHAWRLRRIAPEYLISMITYGIAMSFLSHTYLFLPYVFMAVILAASKVYRLKAIANEDTSSNRTPSNRSPVQRSCLMIALTTFLLACSLPQLSHAEQITALTAQPGITKGDRQSPTSAGQSIKLQGSRGETLSFMLKAAGAGCWPIDIVHDASPSGAPLIEVTFFALPEVLTANPSFTEAPVGAFLDPVIPLPSPPSLCIDTGTPHSWFLGEIRISRDYPPGPSTIHIRAGGRQVDVNLTVWSMTMPEQPTLPAYAELTPWFLVLGHYGAWHPDEAKLAKLYSHEMLEHRVIPLKSVIAPLKEQGGETHRTLDLTHTPSTTSSFTETVLSGRPAWAYYDFPTVGANGTKLIDYTKAESYFKAVQNTLPSVGREGRALVYLWDEPKKDALPELLRLSSLVKRVAPSLKQLVTTPYSQPLDATVDIFCPVMDQFDAAGFPPPSVYKERKQRGYETWWYVSCMSHGCDALGDTGVPDMVLDRPSSHVRSIGWISMKYGIDAFLYYSVNNGYQFAPARDPWQSLWDFSGNGDGTLFYPGRPGKHSLTNHQPIPSLRLKLWRESSFDSEYINWMNKLPSIPEWWKDEWGSIVHSTTSWSRDYYRYQSLRDKAGEYLNQLEARTSS